MFKKTTLKTFNVLNPHRMVRATHYWYKVNFTDTLVMETNFWFI